jgi:2'-5' RNA ligase
MRCGIALIVDNEIHNYAVKKAVEINKLLDNGFIGVRFLAHVSVKQPYHIDDLQEMEKYFDTLTKSLLPFEIEVSGTYLWQQIIGLVVVENSQLRSLHNRINRELKERFTNTEAPYDGDEYRFHVTIAYGGSSIVGYKHAYESVKDENYHRKSIANEMALFYSEEDEGLNFVTYRKSKLG